MKVKSFWPKVFVILFIVLAPYLTPYKIMALDVTLEWDPNTEPDLAGYKVYYDTDSGDPYTGVDADEGNSPITIYLNQFTDINNPEFTLTNLPGGVTNFFAVTAFDDQSRESDYSNEVNTGDDGGVAQGIMVAMSPEPQDLLCAWENEPGKTPDGYNVYISSTHDDANAPIGSIYGDINEFYIDAADNSFCAYIDWDVYDAVHVAIVTVKDGVETNLVVAYYLYANIIGTYETGTPCGSARVDGLDYTEWGTKKYLTATHPSPNCSLSFTFSSDTTLELSDVDGDDEIDFWDRYIIRMRRWGNTAD